MTENTLPYHFFVDRKLSDDELSRLAAICHSVEVDKVQRLHLQQFSPELQVATFCSGQRNTLNLRFYPKELLYTIDVQLMDPDTNIDLAFTRQVETKIRKFLIDLGLQVRLKGLFVPIKRGRSLWRYCATSDERLYEATFDQLVAEVDSAYQNVKIYHSPLFGNVLYLDDDVMFGESDQESYTRVLLGLETGKPARHSFADKEILILGGGDGGVICELLKQRPKMVVMCEIDEEVVRLCRQHMRSACEDALDTYEGPNKRIIIGDCLQHLHECIESGKRYDFIVNDLTEFPVNKEERGWMYDFATENSQVMELSLKALKSDGRYLSRGGSVAGEFFWKVFEEDCGKLGCRFRVFNSQVASFHEEYKLYEVWLDSE